MKEKGKCKHIDHGVEKRSSSPWNSRSAVANGEKQNSEESSRKKIGSRRARNEPETEEKGYWVGCSSLSERRSVPFAFPSGRNHEPGSPRPYRLQRFGVRGEDDVDDYHVPKDRFSSFVRTYSVEKEEEEEEEEGGEVGSGKSTEVGGPWHKVEEDSVIGVRSHACLRRLQVSPGEDSTDLLLRLRLLLLLLSRCARSRASHSFPWPSRRLLFPLPGDRSLCSSLTDPIRRSPSLSRLAGDGSAHLSLTDRPVALVCSCYSGSQVSFSATATQFSQSGYLHEVVGRRQFYSSLLPFGAFRFLSGFSREDLDGLRGCSVSSDYF
ncbi:hypothetical protein AXG93_3384s1320 [Marchantia polymorpha subsp. ruderalis]|uniref:Uncharacterized protein n=1 Tax=Marchantia polymorpha subsp. ruderalis TaxID=1480154 RepID=A0A176WEI3_MARPO|nr:hypothetical protein AXG93_3384s1320 [Marchantia polymorpha subsp. ruderalis]